MLKAELEDFLKDLGMGANQLGHEIYLVGGYVREKLYSEFYAKEAKPVFDLDLVINTNAIDFVQKFHRYYEDNHPQHLSFEINETYSEFGTCKISHPIFPEYQLELASTRLEYYSEPAAFPKVELINNIKEDLPRRDFTINALLESINKKNYGEIIDHANAIKDMKEGLIRVFHKESFIDDPTRLVRAVRFAIQYGFKLETYTKELFSAALNDTKLEEWAKKRRSRFIIELEKLKSLENYSINHHLIKELEPILLFFPPKARLN
jgi:tRNA nucleotidyltransferase (CCA-adding enzyme)